MSEAGTATLIGFEVSNVMSIRLAALEFDDSGGVVRVGGDNGAGKSNLIKGLLWALKGAKALDKHDEVLRHGAEKGWVAVNIGGVGLQVRRSVTDKGTNFIVKDADGATVKRPQEVIDALLGRIGIDPSKLLQLDAKQLAEALREQCGLDFSDLEAEGKLVYDERTATNRKVRDLEGSIKTMAHYPEAPEAEQTVAALLEDVNQARATNDVNQAKRRELDDLRAQAQAKLDRIKELKAELEVLEDNLQSLRTTGQALREEVATLQDVDIEATTAMISKVEETNAQVRANATRSEAKLELAALRTATEGLTERLGELEQERKARVAAAEMPVEGMGFGADGELTLDDKPFAIASDGQRIKAAFEIAVAANPDLRLVLMRQGAYLDDSNRKLVHELAREAGYLVLMEVVGDAQGDVEILVENGQVQQR
jgi:DNA repair exonuclease SbcCD ATPase subunit